MPAGNVELSLLPLLRNFICEKGFGTNFSGFHHSSLAPVTESLLSIQVFVKNKHTQMLSIFCRDEISKNFVHRLNSKQETLTAQIIRLSLLACSSPWKQRKVSAAEQTV